MLLVLLLLLLVQKLLLLLDPLLGYERWALAHGLCP